MKSTLLYELEEGLLGVSIKEIKTALGVIKIRIASNSFAAKKKDQTKKKRNEPPPPTSKNFRLLTRVSSLHIKVVILLIALLVIRPLTSKISLWL